MPVYIRTRDEFAINSFWADNQTAPSVATFADGGFVVIWGTLDGAQDGDSSAIKGQLFDSAGSKVGTEFRVNTLPAGSQFTASVATLGNGNFVVTWVTSGTDPYAMDGSDGIKAQMYNSWGWPVGSEFQVDSAFTGSMFTPVVAALANGGFVISWADSNGFNIKAQIFDSAGSPVGDNFTLNANTSGSQDSADITALANGGFVATWTTQDSSADGSGEAVKAQVFSATGARVGGEFLVNSQAAEGQYDASVTALAGGGFVITWATRDPAQDGSSGAVKGQIFNSSGAKVGGEFLVNTAAADIQREAVVTGTPDGGFVVAWTNYSSSQDGSGFAIKAQAFDSAGAKVGSEMLVNTLTSGSQFLPDIATLADGRVIVTWTSTTGDGEGYAVRAQILGTQLAEPVPNARPIIISPGGTSASLMVEEGTAFVTTVVASDDGEPTDLRYSITGGPEAHLFTINAVTGALSFIQAPDHVEGESNFYTVVVSASDGELDNWQMIHVGVRHVNHVTIVSDGGGQYARVSIDENQTGVTLVGAV
ncbi:MAG TPA: cadherin repeat domain-containing protein, partial [Allosphingosinicella sp.]